MSKCPKCQKQIHQLDFFASTGKYRMAGRLMSGNQAEINFAEKEQTEKELGFYCTECNQMITENPQVAKNII